MKIRKLFYSGIILLLISCNLSNKDEITTLKSVSSFPVGSAENLKRLYSNALYSEITIEEFNSITAENLMKMKNVFISPDSLNYEKTDSLVMFCRENKMRLHGHCFVWHQSIPIWMKEIRDSVKLENLVKDYILKYGSRYKNDVAGWDVVNEASSDSAGLIRESQFSEILGNDFVARMFVYAREACPEAKLFYNDYCTEYNDVKLDSILSMIEDFQKREIPIDGIGFQLHTMLDTPNIETFSAALKRAVETGLLIHISELDVSINTYHKDPEHFKINDSLLNIQKERYFSLVKEYIQIVPPKQRWGLTLWGFCDKHNWIPSFYNRPDWPCIIDSAYNKKPAYYGLLEALKTE
jgi:endo-1,4-beta-xylanase